MSCEMVVFRLHEEEFLRTMSGTVRIGRNVCHFQIERVCTGNDESDCLQSVEACIEAIHILLLLVLSVVLVLQVMTANLNVLQSEIASPFRRI